jgi:hypothetical protein
MYNYDPNNAPDPVDWLELDEQERISLVEAYHKAAKVKLPNAKIHAAVHVVVENQLAGELPSTSKAIPRLMREGLSRHDALHAVGSIVAELMFAALDNKDSNKRNASQDLFDAKVEKLTAEEWKRQFGR